MIELPTEANPVTVIEGDCLDILRALPDSSVELLLTDPPYHKVKGEAWDRQWKTDADYLTWMGLHAHEWNRVLKPNGSLYCFASPRMAWGVEGVIRERFNVLNCIRWAKDDGWAKRQCKEEQRAFFPASETVIFAEHFGADNMAKGEAGYAAKCDELRGFLFEPLRAYLDTERIAAGLTPEQVNVICGFREQGGMAGRHWFSASQFAMPTEKAYATVAAATGRFQRSYEDLRKQYEDLRRPFTVSAKVPYTDVWTFPTVQAFKGKHPCEKPIKMIRHMVTASTRPGDLILDPFAGSGTTGVAAALEGRRCILIEKEPQYAETCRKRIAKVMDAGLFADC